MLSVANLSGQRGYHGSGLSCVSWLSGLSGIISDISKLADPNKFHAQWLGYKAKTENEGTKQIWYIGRVATVFSKTTKTRMKIFVFYISRLTRF